MRAGAPGDGPAPAEGATAPTAVGPAPTGPRGFRLDLDLCTGCSACAVACAVENELPWGTSWRRVETFNAPRHPGLPVYHLSLACNHCADAPCMAHCPALAYTRDPETGAVLLDADRCIGCRYCTWACPYDAPQFEPRSGVVSKCTFCNHRQVAGLAPACVDQCPTGALSFGPVDALDGVPAVAGFPLTEAGPSIRFAARRRDRLQPPPDAPGGGSAKTTLASEWPLLVFTLTCAALVGVMATETGRRLVSLPVFLALAAGAAAASTLHLGRKARAWRAILNLRGSWLSREAALFGLFSALAAWHLSGWAAPDWTGPAAAVAGAALLFAVDRVYLVTRTPGLALHSARTLLTGVLVAALVADVRILWMGALGLKGLEYAGRHMRRLGAGGVVLPLARLLGGLAAPAVLFLTRPEWGLLAWVLVAVGEIVDRAEFYTELRVPTPSAQIRADLRALLSGSDAAGPFDPAAAWSPAADGEPAPAARTSSAE